MLHGYIYIYSLVLHIQDALHVLVYWCIFSYITGWWGKWFGKFSSSMEHLGLVSIICSFAVFTLHMLITISSYTTTITVTVTFTTTLLLLLLLSYLMFYSLQLWPLVVSGCFNKSILYKWDDFSTYNWYNSGHGCMVHILRLLLLPVHTLRLLRLLLLLPLYTFLMPLLQYVMYSCSYNNISIKRLTTRFTRS